MTNFELEPSHFVSLPSYAYQVNKYLYKILLYVVVQCYIHQFALIYLIFPIFRLFLKRRVYVLIISIIVISWICLEKTYAVG